MKKIFLLLGLILSTALIAGWIYIGVVYAINTWDTGYQFVWTQTKDITLSDSSCRKVTAGMAGTSFIPTRTMGEFNSFVAIAASRWATVGSCVVCWNSVCESWENCSNCSGDCWSCATAECWFSLVSKAPYTCGWGGWSFFLYGETSASCVNYSNYNYSLECNKVAWAIRDL